MPTYSAQDIVKRALRTIGVLEAEESPTAAEQLDAIEDLNDLLHAWTTKGIGNDHVDLDVDGSDELVLDNDEYRALRLSLACELADSYLVPPQTMAAVNAKKEGAMRLIEAKYSSPRDLCTDAALTVGGSRYNITTD